MHDCTKPVEERPYDHECSYEQALALKERTKGFAALIGALSEYRISVDESEMEGIARLALDISESAERLFQRIRAEAPK